MNVLSRGIRNAFRNLIRTFSIVFILGISVGLALAMLVARQAVQDKITTVKSTIGNTISVSPAGARGFEGGGEALKTDQLDKITKLANVKSVTQSLSDRLTSETSDLESAIDAGSLGRRQAGNSGVGFMVNGSDAPGQGAVSFEEGASPGQVSRIFTPPVTITGVKDATQASAYGGSTLKFTSGQAIDASKDEDKAVVGSSLAEKNNLSVGSTFTAYGKKITVAGIYDAGNDFANNGVVVSLAALQRLSDQADAVTSATITVNSIDNVDSVLLDAQKTLGDTADLVSNAESAKQSVAPLENVKTIALFSLIGAVVAGAIIILLTMMMIVRERRREIGVMKAIGASNIKIMLQFVSEAVALTVLGMIVGLGIGVAAANPITNVLVTNSANSSNVAEGPAGGVQTVTVSGPRPGGLSRGPGVVRSFSSNSVANIRNIKASVGLDILGYGIGAAMIIAIVGSALPAFLISKIRPAEVLRAD